LFSGSFSGFTRTDDLVFQGSGLAAGGSGGSFTPHEKQNKKTKTNTPNFIKYINPQKALKL